MQGRLDRLGLGPDELAQRLRLPAESVARLLSGGVPPRGRRLQRLADTLECSVAYLVGLDPDAPPPTEMLAEDQGDFGLLAGDEEALLFAYRTLDAPSRAALLHVVQRMAMEKQPG